MTRKAPLFSFLGLFVSVAAFFTLSATATATPPTEQQRFRVSDSAQSYVTSESAWYSYSFRVFTQQSIPLLTEYNATMSSELQAADVSDSDVVFLVNSGGQEVCWYWGSINENLAIQLNFEYWYQWRVNFASGFKRACFKADSGGSRLLLIESQVGNVSSGYLVIASEYGHSLVYASKDVPFIANTSDVDNPTTPLTEIPTNDTGGTIGNGGTAPPTWQEIQEGDYSSIRNQSTESWTQPDTESLLVLMTRFTTNIATVAPSSDCTINGNIVDGSQPDLIGMGFNMGNLNLCQMEFFPGQKSIFLLVAGFTLTLASFATYRHTLHLVDWVRSTR